MFQARTAAPLRAGRPGRAPRTAVRGGGDPRGGGRRPVPGRRNVCALPRRGGRRHASRHVRRTRPRRARAPPPGAPRRAAAPGGQPARQPVRGRPAARLLRDAGHRRPRRLRRGRAGRSHPRGRRPLLERAGGDHGPPRRRGLPRPGHRHAHHAPVRRPGTGVRHRVLRRRPDGLGPGLPRPRADRRRRPRRGTAGGLPRPRRRHRAGPGVLPPVPPGAGGRLPRGTGRHQPLLGRRRPGLALPGADGAAPLGRAQRLRPGPEDRAAHPPRTPHHPRRLPGRRGRRAARHHRRRPHLAGLAPRVGGQRPHQPGDQRQRPDVGLLRASRAAWPPTHTGAKGAARTHPARPICRPARRHACAEHASSRSA
ncbi:hypothetical protein SALBM135S_08040 [Streptomyces alboniger]